SEDITAKIAFDCATFPRAGPGNLNKLDKWKFCLNAASAAVNRREHDEETTPEPRPGLQGEYQGREDAGRTGRTIRCTSKPDHDLEIAASRRGCRGLWRRDETRFKSARDRCENAARQDRGVDAGTRFFVRSARESRTFAERKAMIDRNDDLPMSRQAKVLGIS